MGTGFFEMIIGNLLSVTAFGMMMAGLLKIFRMSSDISEIKDILREMLRENRPIAPPSGSYPAVGYTAEDQESPMALMRAVNAAAQKDTITYQESPATLRRP